MTKHCPDCRLDKPESVFTRDLRRADGLSFYCRPCRILRDEKSRRTRRGPAQTRSVPRGIEIPPEHKWCPECGEVKPFAEFPRNRSQRSGLMTYCKPCHNTKGRESRERHGGARTYHLKRRYGIGIAEYDAMFEAQGGLCAICREAPASQVDHDHLTNKVRGLLCSTAMEPRANSVIVRT